MANSNNGCTYQEPPVQAALRTHMEIMEKDRAELVREREHAVRSGHLDLVLEHSRDLRLLHRDYLEGALKAISIRHSWMRQRTQRADAERSLYEGFKRTFGPEIADAKLKSQEEEKAVVDAHDAANPFINESFTTGFVRDGFVARIEGEITFVENLKRVAQQEGDANLVRRCRNELRLLRNALLEGQMMVSNFEAENPPPIDIRAETARIEAARTSFLKKVAVIAEEAGVIPKS